MFLGLLVVGLLCLVLFLTLDHFAILVKFFLIWLAEGLPVTYFSSQPDNLDPKSLLKSSRTLNLILKQAWAVQTIELNYSWREYLLSNMFREENNE